MIKTIFQLTKSQYGRKRLFFFFSLAFRFQFSELSKYRNRFLSQQTLNSQGLKIDEKSLLAMLSTIKNVNEQSLEDFEYANMISMIKPTVIIPVYGNLQMVNELLADLNVQDVEFECLLIDDASPDLEITEFLAESSEKYSNWLTVYRNHDNIGFVGTVNRGLSLVTKHCIILNSDVRIPANFIREMVKPFLQDSTIASVTPLTNSGSIASIPTVVRDHAVKLQNLRGKRNFSLLKLHQSQNFKCIYPTIPTGVGFAMGLNFEVLNKIGIFDESFAPAYGEEVDWCQRAKHQGYRSVLHPGIYVWHQHGASYSKKRDDLIAEHNYLISNRYKDYDLQVANYISDDSMHLYRIIAALIISQQSDGIALRFSHNLGGGSALWNSEDTSVDFIITVQSSRDTSEFEIRLDLWGDKFSFKVSSEKLWQFLSYIEPCSIEIGSIALLGGGTGLEFSEMLSDFLSSNKKSASRIVIHDYYAICPSYNLLDATGNFCRVPEKNICERCLPRNTFVKKSQRKIDIVEWRESHKNIFENVKEIITLSESSRGLLAIPFENEILKVKMENPYLKLPKLVSVSEKIKNNSEHTRMKKNTKIVSLGNLNIAKGYEVVKKLATYSNQEDLNFEFAHLGDTSSQLPSYIQLLGKYDRESLPRLLKEYDPDFIFIPSIWPETYCFTAEEAWQLGYVVVLPMLGALKDRFLNRDRVVRFNNVEEMSDPKNFFKKMSEQSV